MQACIEIMSDSDSSDDDIQDVHQPLPRVYRDRINFDQRSEKLFVERFRLASALIDVLEERLYEHLSFADNRNHALTCRQQILVSLRMLADNGFYHLNGDAHGVGKQTVCNTLRKFVRAVNEVLYDEVVRFPDIVNYHGLVQQFFEVQGGGIPSVCALLDGSLIKINTPSVDEVQYVDRHGNHSINVMLVTGSDHKIFCCNSSWPGSVHDARGLRNSSLYDLFEVHHWRPFPGAVILAYSAYPCKQWLMPPIIGVQTDPEARFNAAHAVTRSHIERSIGILKQR